jgi:hypothetical protein
MFLPRSTYIFFQHTSWQFKSTPKLLGVSLYSLWFCQVLYEKIFSVHAMKAYSGSRGIAPLILNLSTRWRWVVNFTPQLLYPQKISLVPIDYDAGWAPEPVWTFCRREKCSVCATVRTSDCPIHSLVTVLARLSVYVPGCKIVLSWNNRLFGGEWIIWNSVGFLYSKLFM